MNDHPYHQRKIIEYTKNLREILLTLPSFSKDYFRAIEPTTSPKTRVSYAYDIRIFFNFLKNNNPLYQNKDLTSLTIDDLEKIQVLDIEEYQEYLKLYLNNNKELTNTERGISRKMSALRSFFNYYYKHQFISSNPALMVSMPKIHEKSIIKLDTDEVVALLDYIENCGDLLDNKRKDFYEKTKFRDLALITLLLGTGIRVSECVGLDLKDVDFKNNGLTIVRKGGNEMVVYFGDEVYDALYDYINLERNLITPVEGHEGALFYSIQKKRLSVRAVEDLVKKYASVITNKKITPHKLRSTYGTTLYKETNDIYLVADVLGHKDVNTTRKHYAQMNDDNRRRAARAVTLRESESK
ncbi:MAG: tyrosine-type recombinase/integrase [Lachnospiraceae bacterium]|nr:tyrosine-type recombinase/integrase [Lachnospiraceae bacterium]